MIFVSVACFLFLITYTSSVNLGEADLVISLPGLGSKPTFKHYSGYLNVSKHRYFHYWFIESQSKPSNDPVILWLNGGPGCSSLGGMFNEIGPWRVNDDGKTLRIDNSSWNQMANIIFFESPAGVGFSYQEQNNLTTDDEQTALDNYLALKELFVKFPSFKTNDFFITGQSYAGVYIPMLALKVLEDPHHANINLKGIAIGNGDFNTNIIYNARMKFAFNHALVDTSTWNKAIDYCCGNNSFGCDFFKSSRQSNNCLEIITQIREKIYLNNGINPYNIYKDCYRAPTGDEDTSKLNSPNLTNDLYHIKERIASQDFGFGQVNSSSKIVFPPCVDGRYGRYLNNESVRKAMHIRSDAIEWGACNDDVFDVYIRQVFDLKPTILELIKRKLSPIIIYSGDVDMLCDTMSSQLFIDSLNLKIEKPFHAWVHDNQTAGFVKRFEKGLSFVTVKGAGHMAPEDKPQQMLAILRELIGKVKLV